MKKLYETSAIAVGGRDGVVKSADGLINLQLSTPSVMGGKGGATNPESILASGWAACFNSAVALAARQEGIVTGEINVKVTITLGITEDEHYQFAAEIEAIIPGVSQPTAMELVRKAETICPFSRSMKGNVETKLSAKVI